MSIEKTVKTSIFNNSSNAILSVGTYCSGEVIENSSSGGAFTALFEFAIEHGYYVVGVKYGPHLTVIHDIAKTIDECMAFRKSKYIMSDVNDCYKKIAQLLLRDNKVLFSGTPCQCAALSLYLKCKKVNLENLIIVDLICHGVANQKIFNSYLEELEKRKKDSIEKYSFKNKKAIKGKINSRSAEILYKSGKCELVTMDHDPFLRGYYARLFYRRSCEECRFARPDRVSDITIGDAWGIEKINPKFDPMKGVSLIIANNNQGKIIVGALSSKMDLESVTLQWAIENNTQLREASRVNNNRAKFFDLWKSEGFTNSVFSCTKQSFVKKWIAKVVSKLSV